MANEKSGIEPATKSTLEDAIHPPTEEEFDLPTNKEHYESMVDRFATIGLKRPDVNKVLESRCTAFNKAHREFKIAERKRKSDEAKLNKKPRKNSLTK